MPASIAGRSMPSSHVQPQLTQDSVFPQLLCSLRALPIEALSLKEQFSKKAPKSLQDELRAANARMGPRESASSSGQRDLFQVHSVNSEPCGGFGFWVFCESPGCKKGGGVNRLSLRMLGRVFG